MSNFNMPELTSPFSSNIVWNSFVKFHTFLLFRLFDPNIVQIICCKLFYCILPILHYVQHLEYPGISSERAIKELSQYYWALSALC